MSQQKKETLKKVLETLIPYRNMAEWFLLLLNEDWNDDLKEELYQEILKQIKEIKSSSQQEKVKKAINQLKEKSEKTIKDDENEAEQILNDFLNNI